nr:MAG TPA_asm: hypothetical protein [Caudoviricetes sp.]
MYLYKVYSRFINKPQEQLFFKYQKYMKNLVNLHLLKSLACIKFNFKLILLIYYIEIKKFYN